MIQKIIYKNSTGIYVYYSILHTSFYYSLFATCSASTKEFVVQLGSQ